jgi:hypothetical protein
MRIWATSSRLSPWISIWPSFTVPPVPQAFCIARSSSSVVGLEQAAGVNFPQEVVAVALRPLSPRKRAISFILGSRQALNSSIRLLAQTARSQRDRGYLDFSSVVSVKSVVNFHASFPFPSELFFVTSVTFCKKVF